MTRSAVWWSRVGYGLWRCDGPGHMTAEVRQVGDSRYLMSVEDRGDCYTGSFARQVDAMRKAEGIMGELLEANHDR